MVVAVMLMPPLDIHTALQHLHYLLKLLLEFLPLLFHRLYLVDLELP